MNLNVTGSEGVDGIKVAQDGGPFMGFYKNGLHFFSFLKGSDMLVCMRHYQFPKKVCPLFGALVVASEQGRSVYSINGTVCPKTLFLFYSVFNCVMFRPLRLSTFGQFALKIKNKIHTVQV